MEFDCLVSIPLHSGDPVIEKSGLGDDFGFVPADKHTLQSRDHENIFVIGDAGNFPTSKKQVRLSISWPRYFMKISMLYRKPSVYRFL
ncbi:MAG: hypothetical protein R2744_10120 [Bacteroidales bacterium]